MHQEPEQSRVSRGRAREAGGGGSATSPLTSPPCTWAPASFWYHLTKALLHIFLVITEFKLHLSLMCKYIFYVRGFKGFQYRVKVVIRVMPGGFEGVSSDILREER